MCSWSMSSNLQSKENKVKTGKLKKMENSYLIIGKLLNPEDFNLEKKIAKDEVLISVPKEIIDKKRG